jgi:hypothetical protein
MRENNPQPQHPTPVPEPHPPEPRPQPQTPETRPLSGRKYLCCVKPQKPRLAVPALQEAEVAGNTSDVDMVQRLLIKLAGGYSCSDVRLPGIPLHDGSPYGLVGKE